MYLSIYYTRLLFCLFWVCWVPGNFSGGPGHIFLLCGALLCGVSGRYYLFGCEPGVGGGAVRVFLLLGSVEVGTVRLKWWGGWSDSLGRLQFAVCSLGRRLSVVGLPFPYNNFYLFLFRYYLSVPYFISC